MSVVIMCGCRIQCCS